MAGNEQVYQEAMNQGHSAAWDQRWDKAAEFYRKAVEEMPDRAPAITSLGLAFYEQQQYEQAQACYAKAASLTPDDPLPIEKIAEIFERTGKITEAADMSMRAADLYLKLKDADKAIENWARITRLVPEHLKAHSRLAVVHERLGRKKQSIREYISVASLLQDAGQIEEALQAVNKAVSIDPADTEAQQAMELVRNNKTLPKPKHQRGSTGPLRMAAVRELDGAPPDLNIGLEGPDPIGEARQKALTAMAGLLFDVSSEDLDHDKTAPKGILGVMSSQDEGRDIDLTKISMHLGLAIDFQTRAEEAEAAEELKKAMDAGLSSPAAYFNLGLLYFRLDRKESAQRNLARAVNHPDYAIASRLLIGRYFRERAMPNAAVSEYLEALKLADIAVVQPPELADVLRSQYEPLIEANAQEEDEKALNQLCDNIEEMLVQPNWRQQVSAARAQLPSAVTGSLAMPLAEILTQAESTEMVQAMGKINDLARQGFYRTAMEEAFYLMSTAPTYLPLHIHMGELLLRQERSQEAINKFTIVANTYASRGEANRATDLLRRIVEIAPLDMGARNRLIKTLIDQGEVDVAITEYLNLADAHYRLAQLDTARTTYENALRLAQQANADPSWGKRILHYMADIDLQRLDWRQALRVYEQLRTLGPDDEVARKNLVELNMRLGQETQATAELDNYLNFLSGKAQDQQAVAFLEKIAEENPEFAFVQRRLAQAYQQASRTEDAIKHWDKMAELMVQKGDTESAKEAIRAILVLNPPNVEQYRAVLQKLD